MKGYNDYLEVIDEIEKIEEIITVPKYRRRCHNTLELLKSIILCLKLKSK